MGIRGVLPVLMLVCFWFNAKSSLAADDSQDVDLLLGVGSRVIGTNVTNYKTTSNNILEVTSLGRATPQALVGLGFPFCGSDAAKQESAWLCGNALGYRLSAFVSAQFGTGSDTTVTGYTIGLGIHINTVLHALFGFSMSPIDEPSPGFRRVAAQYVTKNAGQYPGIDPNALLNNTKDAFDGFQYIIPPAAGTTGPSTTIYQGDVLATHYRPGFFIGVSFPLSLKAKLDNGK